MRDFTNYKDKKIIIYDEATKNTIAETKIIDFNMATQTIIVDSRKFRSNCSDHVSVLIFSDSGIFEYRGTVRSMNSQSTMGIALYRGKPLEHRKHARYAVRASGVIEHLMIGGNPVPVPKESQVDVVNISSSGILIRGNAGLLNVGTTFELKLVVDSTVMYLNATVVRTRPVESEQAEFGCQLNSQRTETLKK